MPEAEQEPDLAAIPSQHQGHATLVDARSAAVRAMFEAEQMEKEARRLRRQANQLRKKYERLLLEYNGQQQLPL